MTCHVVASIPSPVEGAGARTIAVREVESREAARAWVLTNRETLRSVLEDGEMRVIALVLAQLKPVEAIELDRAWGKQRTIKGKANIRAILRTYHRPLKTPEEKT